ncbi:hypothetical protein BDK51DRAFT_39034 [Blyttiomyces helicus]|uniref:Uncharacterized protein n=1 Tax=Blyttiomyces helicus TaxID=388810 RepID=A0A4P9WPE1_9FUNG|nr:hypothetical protein BDK51DRAFT_39034 [Blyttiomyces helicus]|eukprot:RKO93993.1 hypothetical protein BDK51DRAFT_39034 [Blyttiomyces helicus]
MQEKIDTSLGKWFSQVLTPSNLKFKYMRPIDVCGREGPQTRSEAQSDLGGFCQTWTLFYLDARLIVIVIVNVGIICNVIVIAIVMVNVERIRNVIVIAVVIVIVNVGIISNVIAIVIVNVEC